MPRTSRAGRRRWRRAGGSRGAMAWCWGSPITTLTLSFGGTDYLPAHGLDGGEAAQKLGPQVDTAEVLGVLHAEAITEDDILLGRYDGAVVETWRVNWRDVGAAASAAARDDRRDRARGRRVPGRAALGAACAERAAGADLRRAVRRDGGRCAVRGRSRRRRRFRPTATVAAVRDRYRVVVDGLGGFDAGWFAFGCGRWTGGAA